MFYPWLHNQPSTYYEAIKENNLGDTVYIYYPYVEFSEGRFYGETSNNTKIYLDGEATSFNFSESNRYVKVSEGLIEFDGKIKPPNPYTDKYIIKGQIAEKVENGEKVKYIKGEEVYETSQLMAINGYYYPIQEYFIYALIALIIIIIGALLHIGTEHFSLKKMKKEHEIIIKDYIRLKKIDRIIRSSICIIVILIILIPISFYLIDVVYRESEDFRYLDFSGKKEGDIVQFYVSIVDYKFEDNTYYLIATRYSGSGTYRVIPFSKDIRDKIPDTPKKRILVKVKITDIVINNDDEDSATFEGVSIEDPFSPDYFFFLLFISFFIMVLSLWVWIIFTYKLKKMILWVIKCNDESEEVKFIVES